MKSSFFYATFIYITSFFLLGSLSTHAAYQKHYTNRAPDSNSIPYLDTENRRSVKEGVIGVSGASVISLYTNSLCSSPHITTVSGYSCGISLFQDGLYVGDWNSLGLPPPLPQGVSAYTLRGTGQRKVCVNPNGTFTASACN